MAFHITRPLYFSVCVLLLNPINRQLVFSPTQSVGDYPHPPQKLIWFRRLDLSCFLPISFPSGGGVFIFSAWRYLSLMRCSVSRFGALFSSAVVDARVILSLMIPSCDFFRFCFSRFVLICNGLFGFYFLCHNFLCFLSCGLIFFTFLLSQRKRNGYCWRSEELGCT